VYADFNSLESCSTGTYDSRVDLTSYGSLKSLSQQKLQVCEGMRINVFEPQDIEVEGIAYFDPNEKDPAGRSGKWYVLLNRDEIQDSIRKEPPIKGHPCFGCGENLDDLLMTRARNYTEKCPLCQTSVMKPLEPPQDESNKAINKDAKKRRLL